MSTLKTLKRTDIQLTIVLIFSATCAFIVYFETKIVVNIKNKPLLEDLLNEKKSKTPQKEFTKKLTFKKEQITCSHISDSYRTHIFNETEKSSEFGHFHYLEGTDSYIEFSHTESHRQVTLRGPNESGQKIFKLE